MPSLISCRMAAKVMAGVSDVDVLLGGILSTKDNTGYDKDEDNDANGGNDDERKIIEEEDGMVGISREGVKIAGEVIGSGDEIDADHAGCQDTRKSTSGSMQLLGEILVNAITTDRLWPCIQQDTTNSDNKSAIALCCNNVQHSQSNHIDIRHHFIKEQVENRVVEMYLFRIGYQLADIFTKPLVRERLEFLINKLGMLSMSLETLIKMADEEEE
ncbi:hypothetical protein Tco_0461679 [Tanacetum coccineum]